MQLNREKDMKEKRTVKQQIPEPYMTQREVAEVFGVHRHDIAKIEATALRKLWRILKEKGYDKSNFF